MIRLATILLLAAKVWCYTIPIGDDATALVPRVQIDVLPKSVESVVIQRGDTQVEIDTRTRKWAEQYVEDDQVWRVVTE